MKIKPFVTITLFIFWAAVTAILTAGLVFYQANKAGVQPVDKTSGQGTSSGNIVLLMEEITKHNSAADCWMVNNNKVYDVTSAISAHPGGHDAIIPYCGKDGTKVFKTKNKSTPEDHSAKAYSWLDSLYIGDVGQTVSNSAVQNVKQAAPATGGQHGSEGYDD